MKNYILKFIRAILALTVHSKAKALAVANACIKAVAITSPAVTLDEAADLVRAFGGLVRSTTTDGMIRVFVRKDVGWGTGTSASIADFAEKSYRDDPSIPTAMNAAVFATIDGRDISEFVEAIGSIDLPDDLEDWQKTLGEDIRGFLLLSSLADISARVIPVFPPKDKSSQD